MSTNKILKIVLCLASMLYLPYVMASESTQEKKLTFKFSERGIRPQDNIYVRYNPQDMLDWTLSINYEALDRNFAVKTDSKHNNILVFTAKYNQGDGSVAAWVQNAYSINGLATTSFVQSISYAAYFGTAHGVLSLTLPKNNGTVSIYSFENIGVALAHNATLGKDQWQIYGPVGQCKNMHNVLYDSNSYSLVCSATDGTEFNFGFDLKDPSLILVSMEPTLPA